MSAFANSAGGALVYGMKENGHVPTALDIGYDPNDISKEWLEQVINSRIQRRIDGVRVNEVSLAKTAPGKVAYVVFIPQSTRAPHQAADKRFYKRFNFESVPMEEYEIRDVAHRSSAPDLDIDFAFRPGGATTALQEGEGGFFAPVDIAAVVRNDSETPAECAVIHLFIDQRIRIDKVGSEVRKSADSESVICDGTECPLQKLTILWGTARGFPIFVGITVELPTDPLRIAIPIGPAWFLLRYRIGSPEMAVKDNVVVLTIREAPGLYKGSELSSTSRHLPAPCHFSVLACCPFSPSATCQ